MEPDMSNLITCNMLDAAAGGELWQDNDGDAFTGLPGNTLPPAPVGAVFVDLMLDHGWIRGGGGDPDGSFHPLELTEAGEAELERLWPGRLAVRRQEREWADYGPDADPIRLAPYIRATDGEPFTPDVDWDGSPDPRPTEGA